MSSQNQLEIEGTIQKYVCAEIFAEIFQAKFSGSLRLSNDALKVNAYFDEGKVVFAVSNSKKHRLFEILLSENAIPKEKIVEIEGFTHDLHLAKKLVEENLLTKRVVDSIFSIQIKQILRTVWSWETGKWQFSPLARAKEGIKFEVELDSLLRKQAESISTDDVLGRFKSLTESFSLSSDNTDIESLNPDPKEAFLLSRLGSDTLTVDELRSMSGLSSEELFVILYQLWMGGIVKRKNWNPTFKEEDQEKIANAKLTLKRSATSFEEEQEKAQKEKEIAEEEERAREEAEQKEKAKKAKNIPLDDYLKRVEDAVTHYEMFGVNPDAKIAKIKKAYFSYAKRFHPDLFYKKVDDKKHRRIQDAFTEIARAYDTLKDKDAREIYDFKLRKVIEASKNKDKTMEDLDESFEAHKSLGEAKKQFDHGYQLLDSNKPSEALPFLERAAKLDDENARYHAFFGKALSYDSSNRHQAESELQTAVRKSPRNTTYRFMLAKLYADIGLSARASAELNKVLNIDADHEDARSLLDSLTDK